MRDRAATSAAVIDLTGPAVLGALGASIGAVLADAVVQCLDGRLAYSDWRLPLLAALTAAITWTAHIALLAWGAGLAWPAELSSGVIVLSAFAAAALGGLAACQRTRAGATDHP